MGKTYIIKVGNKFLRSGGVLVDEYPDAQLFKKKSEAVARAHRCALVGVSALVIVDYGYETERVVFEATAV